MITYCDNNIRSKVLLAIREGRNTYGLIGIGTTVPIYTIKGACDRLIAEGVISKQEIDGITYFSPVSA